MGLANAPCHSGSKATLRAVLSPASVSASPCASPAPTAFAGSLSTTSTPEPASLSAAWRNDVGAAQGESCEDVSWCEGMTPRGGERTRPCGSSRARVKAAASDGRRLGALTAMWVCVASSSSTPRGRRSGSWSCHGERDDSLPVSQRRTGDRARGGGATVARLSPGSAARPLGLQVCELCAGQRRARAWREGNSRLGLRRLSLGRRPGRPEGPPAAPTIGPLAAHRRQRP